MKCCYIYCFVILGICEGRQGSTTAPQILFFHRQSPQELEGQNTSVTDNVGYITFGDHELASHDGHSIVLLMLSDCFKI